MQATQSLTFATNSSTVFDGTTMSAMGNGMIVMAPGALLESQARFGGLERKAIGPSALVDGLHKTAHLFCALGIGTFVVLLRRYIQFSNHKKKSNCDGGNDRSDEHAHNPESLDASEQCKKDEQIVHFCASAHNIRSDH